MMNSCSLAVPPANTVLFNADFTTQPAGSGSLASYGMTYARASGATVQTTASTITTSIGNDTPRFYYDGTYAGLLVEPNRTNYVADRLITAASYTAGSGAAYTGSKASPDGSGVGVRAQVNSGGYSRYLNPSGMTAGVYTVAMSNWQVQGSSSVLYQFTGAYNTGTAVAAFGGSAPATYTRMETSGLLHNGTLTYIAVDGENWTAATVHAGIAAGARDVITDCPQVERDYVSSYIPTSGGIATRSADIPGGIPSTVCDGGTVSMHIECWPLGSSSNYPLSAAIWAIDASNFVVLNAAATITVVQAGTHDNSVSAMTFAAYDDLELWIVAGGGVPTHIAYRVNGGAVQVLYAAGAPLGAFAGTIYLCNDGTDSKIAFGAIVKNVTCYKKGAAPAGF